MKIGYKVLIFALIASQQTSIATPRGRQDAITNMAEAADTGHNQYLYVPSERQIAQYNVLVENLKISAQRLLDLLTQENKKIELRLCWQDKLYFLLIAKNTNPYETQFPAMKAVSDYLEATATSVEEKLTIKNFRDYFLHEAKMFIGCRKTIGHQLEAFANYLKLILNDEFRCKYFQDEELQAATAFLNKVSDTIEQYFWTKEDQIKFEQDKKIEELKLRIERLHTGLYNFHTKANW